jgi:hypothetical protein
MKSRRFLTSRYFVRKPDVCWVVLLTAVLGLLLVSALCLSVNWRMEHDVPCIHYVAFLVNEFDAAPYRDAFDTCMPGTYLLHVAVGKCLGYGDRAIRLVSIAWLLGILAVSWRLLAPFGRPVAWAGVILFGLAHVQQGRMGDFQRDYLTLLPISGATLLAVSTSGKKLWLRSAVIGFLFGMVATIKPHLAVGYPFLFCIFWRQQSDPEREHDTRPTATTFILQIAVSLIGFALALVAVLIWLWRQGGLHPFVEMVTSYLPLYVQITKHFEFLAPWDRLVYVVRELRQFGGYASWLAPAVLGIFIILYVHQATPVQRSTALALAGLVILYGVCPAMSGQFWPYHWEPFLYFVIMASALSLLPVGKVAFSRGARLFVVSVLTATLVLASSGTKLIQPLRGDWTRPPKEGRVDEIADFLRDNMQTGDTVQSVDWIDGGAVHALLQARARIATPYLFNFCFYHHLSNPVIQDLRQRFLRSLDQTAPRFVVYFPKVPVHGQDTGDFPELEHYLARHYVPVRRTNHYSILERRSELSPSASN